MADHRVDQPLDLLLSQQALELQQGSCMAPKACVPVYDTVTQDCRPRRCNYSEASRAIWTSSLQVTGQVDMAIFWPHQQRTHRRPSIGHTDRNAEKFEIKPTNHQPLGEDACVKVSQKSRRRLINGLMTRQSQSSQEYTFANVSTKAFRKTNIKSQMR